MASKKPVIQLKVRLILYDRGRILLLRQTKPNGGNYTLVGGTVEIDESARGALVRESREEAGITLREEDLQLVHVLEKHLRKDKRRLVFYFKALRWEGKLVSGEPEKFKQAEWHDLDNLPARLTATVRQVLGQYRIGRIYSEISIP